MTWDFCTERDFQQQLDWMAQFVREEIWPLATLELDRIRLDRALRPLQEQVRARGLWAAQLQAARLMTLHAAWKIDTEGAAAARTDVSMIKFHGAQVLHDVIDRARQIHGALGTRPTCRVSND
ncbi:MAG: Acyl-CoA dehydrogenase [uncultured Solirubrobacteraceae bacterium]|uniref:Acyl-CoA dehydrogenase n=1 Tax=uncultured Solirubrobacteraceae bacterium TaxID=1162706 RepID=A0A6J4SUA8_9ACTN|nr:MAG: Acyl-CoA dehydrogenase [uncultured Solirubrobacteraceae bacterium]